MGMMLLLVAFVGRQARFLTGGEFEMAVYLTFRNNCYIGKTCAKRAFGKLPGPCARLIEHERLLLAHRRVSDRHKLAHPFRYEQLRPGFGKSLCYLMVRFCCKSEIDVAERALIAWGQPLANFALPKCGRPSFTSARIGPPDAMQADLDPSRIVTRHRQRATHAERRRRHWKLYDAEVDQIGPSSSLLNAFENKVKQESVTTLATMKKCQELQRLLRLPLAELYRHYREKLVGEGVEGPCPLEAKGTVWLLLRILSQPNTSDKLLHAVLSSCRHGPDIIYHWFGLSKFLPHCMDRVRLGTKLKAAIFGFGLPFPRSACIKVTHPCLHELVKNNYFANSFGKLQSNGLSLRRT